MAELRTFVFQCADTDLYALTLYRSGENLPTDACQGRWHYRGELMMTRQSLGTLPLNPSRAIAELRTNGLFLARFGSAIIFFPN
jgi:hypothetical protein